MWDSLDIDDSASGVGLCRDLCVETSRFKGSAIVLNLGRPRAARDSSPKNGPFSEPENIPRSCE